MEKVIMRRRRHIAKAITWRIIGTLDTFVLSWLITKEPLTAGWIAIVELITKTILYYFHERAWFASNLGIENRKKHIFKTISWRIIGTLDTLLLSWLITGQLKLGLLLSGFEIITKMALYYMHERVWFASNWGIIKPPKD
jgi:uncharacterized membrane protein